MSEPLNLKDWLDAYDGTKERTGDKIEMLAAPHAQQSLHEF